MKYPPYSSVIFTSTQDNLSYSFNFHEMAELFEKRRSTINIKFHGSLIELYQHVHTWDIPFTCEIFFNEWKDPDLCGSEEAEKLKRTCVNRFDSPEIYTIPEAERFTGTPETTNLHHDQNTPTMHGLRKLITDLIVATRKSALANIRNDETAINEPAKLQDLLYLDPLIVFHPDFEWRTELHYDTQRDNFLLRSLKVRHQAHLLLACKNTILQLFSDCATVENCFTILELLQSLLDFDEFKVFPIQVKTLKEKLQSLPLSSDLEDDKRLIKELEELDKKLAIRTSQHQHSNSISSLGTSLSHGSQVGGSSLFANPSISSHQPSSSTAYTSPPPHIPQSSQAPVNASAFYNSTAAKGYQLYADALTKSKRPQPLSYSAASSASSSSTSEASVFTAPSTAKTANAESSSRSRVPGGVPPRQTLGHFGPYTSYSQAPASSGSSSGSLHSQNRTGTSAVPSAQTAATSAASSNNPPVTSDKDGCRVQ
jgi:hypothetical protein